jgi:hypothetical protein
MHLLKNIIVCFAALNIVQSEVVAGELLKSGANVAVSREACSVDSDCTAVHDCCGCWKPINKQYIKEMARLLKTCQGCDASCYLGNQPVATCIDNVCKMDKAKTTGVTEEAWRSEINKEAP